MQIGRLRQTHIPALAGLTLFTLAFYERVVRSLGSGHWPSNLEDGASFAWNLWYFSKQITHLHDPFITHDIFYPVGAPLGFHTFTPLLGLIAWPFIQLFGLTNTYTLFTLVDAVLCAFGAYFLVTHLVGNRWAAFYAGCAYAALPDQAYRMVGHFNLNQAWILPFALLALLRFYEAPKRRTAIALGIVCGLSLWVDLIFAAFIVIALIAVALCKWRITFTKPVLVKWVGAAAVALVVSSLPLFAMVRDLKNGQLDSIHGWGEADHTNADVFSYLIPSQFNPVTGSWFTHAQIRYTAGERFAFIGWSVLVLAVGSFVVWRSPWKRTIVTLTATFFVLSLGPFLLLHGWHGNHFSYMGARFDLPLPYFLLHFVPIVNGVRIPARFEFMTNLLLIALAAAALAMFMKRLKNWTPVIALTAVALVTIESLPGKVPPMKPTAIPAPYNALKNDPGTGAVIDLPLQWRDGFGQIGDVTHHADHTVFLYYATRYNKPLANGMVARYPDKSEAALLRIPIYSQILTLQHDEGPQPVTFGANELKQLGIGYVVGHRDITPEDAFVYVSQMHLPVLADDGNTIVWKVS